MLSSCRILVSHANRTARRVSLAPRFLTKLTLLTSFGLGLTACGQQGPLYLPTEPAAANRATLLQTLLPRSSAEPASQNPASAASPDAVPPAQGAATPPSAPPSR